MSRIRERFEALEARREKALVVFVTAGDPPIKFLPDILEALVEGGADLIEIGIPFSDPIADGPTIQASSQRALDRHTRLTDIFEAVKKTKLRIPSIYMGYTNIALRKGFQEFAKAVRESGVDGVLLSDLTPEESKEWRESAAGAGLDTVFLVAPTSTEERIELASKLSSGFVYCVSRTGVTGAERAVPEEVKITVEKIRKHTTLPVCVGFGISKPEQVKMVCEVADGAVVGSYIVDLLHQEWNDGKGARKLIEAVSVLKKATKL